jgi:hypothetical protein
MTIPPHPFPDVRRADCGVALVWPRHVAGPERQQAEAAGVMADLTERGLPDGFLSCSAFGSTDGETLMIYAQWTSDDTYRQFAGREDSAKRGDWAQPIRFALYRSSVLDPGATPGVLVAPTFDVDGPDRQRRSIDALLDGPLSVPVDGLIASHFHTSLDGSRVLNWAEWRDEGGTRGVHAHLHAARLPRGHHDARRPGNRRQAVHAPEIGLRMIL